MRRLLTLSALLVVLAAAAAPAQNADKDAILEDERKLKDAYQNTDGDGIVKFLTTRAKGAVDPKTLDALIEKLDAKEASERHAACQQLIAIGVPTLPKLRLAARDPDASEVALLAKRLVKVLTDDPANVTGAAVRLLAARQPKGTAEALLAYLPHAEDDAVTDDIRAALVGVAHEKGSPSKSMLAALEDPHPLLRANAIMALCSGGQAEPRDALRKLLNDKSPSVRLRAALSLGRASDSKAVSALIALLADLPKEQAVEVEGFLVDLAVDQAPNVPLGDDDASKLRCRDAWAKWWLDSDGPNLNKELERRTLTEEAMAKANQLIERLGDDSFDERQKAEVDLKKMGPMILPMLKTALKHADLEVRNRSQKLFTALEADSKTPLSVVVPRLIALRKPKGAVESILAYVPFVEDETMMDELQTALNSVAFVKGKADPAIVKALDDKVPSRRAAAAAALCAGPLADNMELIRKMLKDKDGNVRLKTALALAAAKEKEAVPVLIQLVADLPPETSSTAEDYLIRLSRDKSPENLPEGEKGQKDRAVAWGKWWDDNLKTTVMLDKNAQEAKQRYLGHVLLIQPNNNQITELDKNKKTVMTMTGLLNPWDAQYLSGNKILVTEFNGMRVTERDLKGKLLWEMRLPWYPVSAERQRNGDTFIVGQNQAVLVNRAKKELMKINRPNDGIRTARMLPNGHVMVLTNTNQYIRMDRTGKELKSVRLPQVVYQQNEILDNGNIIVPLGWNNRIVEYTADAKEVWSMQSEQPLHAVRLPNKHVLVSSQNWPYKYLEYDKTGKKLNEHVTNTYVYRVRGR